MENSINYTNVVINTEKNLKCQLWEFKLELKAAQSIASAKLKPHDDSIPTNFEIV